MPAKFSTQDIVEATNGIILSEGKNKVVGRVVWKLEDIQSGDWFIAISSSYQDSHDDLKEAVTRGACGCIVNRRANYAFAPKDSDINLIAVADTKSALLDLVRAWRFKVNPRVIGVSGGSGRQSTMVLIHEFLKENYRIHLAFMNSITWLSCIKEVLAMPAETELLIFEAGGIERGDVSRISGSLDPQFAVLTRLNKELTVFKRDVLQAAMYCEILEAIDNSNDNGYAVIYDASPLVTARVKDLQCNYQANLFSQTSSLSLNWLKAIEIETISAAMQDAIGCNVMLGDLWCAVETAKAMGLTQAKIAEFFVDVEPAIH